MRGATDIKDLKIMVDGKKGKVMSFHVTEDSQVYTKIRLSDGTNVNYRLTQLDPEMRYVIKNGQESVNTI
jgi:hypothetical protein